MKDFTKTQAAQDLLEAYNDVHERICRWHTEEYKAVDNGDEQKALRCKKKAEEAESESRGMLRAMSCFGLTIEFKRRRGHMECVLAPLKKYPAGGHEYEC